jgi:hypothetical protein
MSSTRASPTTRSPCHTRKFRALHKFRKERRRTPRGCFECGDTTHFIVDCPKRKKLDFDSSNKYNNNNQNDSSNKSDNKKYRFTDKKKKKFQKIMSRVCAALSDFDFSSDDSSSSEGDEKVKCKQCNFTGLCLMDKSSRNISDSDFDVCDDLSPESLSSRVVELENALCNQDKLLCKIFCENKKLNLEDERAFSEIASFRSLHDGMSAKPCDNYNMIYCLCTLKLQVNLGVPSWNLESSNLVPYCYVLAIAVLCLDLIWKLLPLRLKILSTDLIMLLTTLF